MNRLLLTSVACLSLVPGIANAQTYDTAAGSAAKIQFGMAGIHTNVKADCAISSVGSQNYPLEFGMHAGHRSLHHHPELTTQVNMTSIGKMIVSLEDDITQVNQNGDVLWSGSPSLVGMGMGLGTVTDPSQPEWNPGGKWRWQMNGPSSYRADQIAVMTLGPKYTGNVRFKTDAVYFAMPDDYVDDPHYDVTAILTWTCYSD